MWIVMNEGRLVGGFSTKLQAVDCAVEYQPSRLTEIIECFSFGFEDGETYIDNKQYTAHYRMKQIMYMRPPESFL